MARDTGIVKLNLRLSKTLHRHLVQQAKRNNTSLNTEIINILERDRTIPPLNVKDLIKETADVTARVSSASIIHTLESRRIIPPEGGDLQFPPAPPKKPESK
jgi:hypothetical protein